MDLRYADSHVHLDRYDDSAVAAMLARAEAAGVDRVLAVGVDAATSSRAVALARRHPGVRAAIGLHPGRVATAAPDDNLAALAALIKDERGVVAAVGEIGIDRPADAAGAAAQRRAFAAQLELAAAAGLPVLLHSVGAHAVAAAVLDGFRARLPAVVVHYFAGDTDEARRWLGLGCHISFGRLLLKPGQVALREAARCVPLDRLLVETDTYPQPGRATEPRDVVEVAAALAALRGEPLDLVARRTRANLEAVLGG